MRYTIRHIETGNMIDNFTTEAGALAAAGDELEATASADALALQRERAGEHPEFVASGPALVIRAFRAGQSPALPDRSHAGSLIVRHGRE